MLSVPIWKNIFEIQRQYFVAQEQEFQEDRMNRIIKYILSSAIILGAASISFGQDDEPKGGCSVDNKEAVKLYEKGIDRKKYQKNERMDFLRKAIELEPGYAEANLTYAEGILQSLRLDNKPFKPAEPYLLAVIENCPDLHSNPYYYLGFSMYEQEKWDDAAKYLKKFVDFTDDDLKKFDKNYEFFLEQSKEMLKYAKFFSEIYKNPVPFDPQLVAGLCTEKDEVLPYISPDGEIALFTRRMYYQKKDMSWQTDKVVEIFSISKKKSGSFEEGKNMPVPFNQQSNEGGATLSIDNKHLFYTICKDEGGTQMNCDIWYSDLVNGEWTELKNLGKPNDPTYWDSQPTIAADGRTIYFSSDRKGGYGGQDLWKTVKDDATGEWGAPVNLGPKINTPGNEKAPFMHSDSETLYFSSDGHPSVGGFDIYLARKNEKGEWIEPKNIGYPINSEGDEIGFFVSTDGKYGYFASNDANRVKGRVKGGYDIYQFELYDAARPASMIFGKGEVRKQDGTALEGVKVEVKNARTKEKLDVVTDTTSGEYVFVSKEKVKDDVIITAKKEGYAFSSQVVSLKDSAVAVGKPLKVNLETKEIKVGESYQLKNIYYATSSADLKPESEIVIDEFAEFLKANPTITVEIQGHTDNVGNANDNLALSNNRAYTVKEMLEAKGIQGSRIKAKGYGATKPIADNSTETGRAKNRRTEFVVLSK
jgi:outer membrane protein OmpA-like peptidoglycan-associated protein/tetratricopeptide (TPR) repeat protein